MNDHGFKVTVKPAYVPSESDPAANRYVFAYTIVIENTGGRPARLMRRHWIITNGDGEKQEVHGPGVVGRQPRLVSGERFRYTSAAILETAVGAMQGHYEFRADDGVEFRVPIPVFSLAVPNVVH